MNYTDEKKQRLREKLELLYQVRMPKKYSKVSSSGYGDSHSAHGLGGSHKPPIAVRRQQQLAQAAAQNSSSTGGANIPQLSPGSFVVAGDANGNPPPSRPQWWG